MEETKSYFCDELNNVLSCMNEKIFSCCSGQSGPVYYEKYKNEKISFDYFYKIKEHALNILASGCIDNLPCKNCFNLREKKANDEISKTYKWINVSHWTACNCGCTYCARMNDSKGVITPKPVKSEYYDFLPLLKQLYKNELLDRENLTACIQGGDISVLKEFKPVVQEFLKNGIKEFHILTNNITYQPIIKDLLDMNKAALVTSLDCGTRETYYKIKRVDKFNDCVNNLRKYAQSPHKDRINVKYILVENKNDNIEEITKFIELMSSIGIFVVEFSIDYKYVLFTDLDKTPLPAHYKDLFIHFKNQCEEKGISLSMWPRVEHIVNNYLLKKEPV